MISALVFAGVSSGAGKTPPADPPRRTLWVRLPVIFGLR